MNTTTQTGVASKQPDPDVKDGEVAVETRSPRDIALEAMGDRQEQNRRVSIDEGLEADPGAASIQHSLEQAQIDNRAAAEAEGLIQPLEAEDGAASVEPMHETPAEPVRKDLPEKLQADPLAEYIVMDKDEPMFVTKINGENVLVPLEDARRRLQIRVAAEVEMKNAREFSKTLDVRKTALDAGEAAFKARVNVAPVQTPAAPTAQVAVMSEEEIAREAQAFVGSAFADDEETAANKLTKLLLKTRTPVAQAAPAPVVDVAGITQRATAAAVQQIDARDQKKDLVEGINTFEQQYPDIIGDANLYSMADNMTDDIVVEHPEWPKSQVMLEAGKRTRKWVEDLKGTPVIVPDDTDVVTEDETISEHTQPPNTQNNRIARKQGLVRIPHAATASAQTLQEEPEQRQSPTEALAETRAARGQPV